MIKAGIIGATGYAGSELLRMLSRHPGVETIAVSSVSYEGKRIDEVFPSFNKIRSDMLIDADTLIRMSDVVFAGVPHGFSEELAVKCGASGKSAVFIDLGADFRLTGEEEYTEWYGKRYEHPDLHTKAVYGLPELNRHRLKNADIIGNPGCYPTSAALGLMPALRNGMIDPGNIIIDAKSGVSGAGRGLTQNTHYPDTNGAFSAYKAASHRHTPEIEQTLSEIAGKPAKITFVPHLLPVNRGIESTMYCALGEKTEYSSVRAAYEDAYRDELFVRVLREGEYANIRDVRCSNYCDISLHYDARSHRLIVCSCIDNMVKGASGQAIQNMNIRFGFPEETAIDMIPCAL